MGTVLTCGLIVGVYYVIPVEPGVDTGLVALRGLGAILLGVAITWLIAREVAHQVAQPDKFPLVTLVAAIVGGVVFFALTDYMIAVSDPDQFVDLATKTDALYFTLATLATVGYGDVHAQGQLARAVVIVQMLFNLVIVATAATVLSRQLSARVRERRGRPPVDE